MRCLLSGLGFLGRAATGRLLCRAAIRRLLGVLQVGLAGCMGFAGRVGWLRGVFQVRYSYFMLCSVKGRLIAKATLCCLATRAQTKMFKMDASQLFACWLIGP